MKTQDITKLSDNKLVALWKRGCEWCCSKMEHNTNGDYNHKLFEKGVARIIAIEDELIRRGVLYGKQTSTI